MENFSLDITVNLKFILNAFMGHVKNPPNKNPVSQIREPLTVQGNSDSEK